MDWSLGTRTLIMLFKVPIIYAMLQFPTASQLCLLFCTYYALNFQCFAIAYESVIIRQVGKLALYDSFILATHISVIRKDKLQPYGVLITQTFEKYNVHVLGGSPDYLIF